ncbi:MAG: glutaredoxin family protein [Wenzhouxiangellaceae bacterium]
MTQTAQIYRMVMDKHLCPYGLKARHLLQRAGFAVEDHHLTSRAETDEFKQRHQVDTTPQIWIGDQRIGGYDALRQHLGMDSADQGASYQPVMVLFAMALLIALAMALFVYGDAGRWRVLEWFVALSVCLLAVTKLQNVERFSLMFLNYDLLAQRWVPYAKIYPFAEALGGLLMLAGVLPWLAAPLMLFIGSIGAVSVIKAVYIDQRELKCACVGGDSNVPLGFVSLTENLVMIGMGVWLLISAV